MFDSSAGQLSPPSQESLNAAVATLLEEDAPADEAAGAPEAPRRLAEAARLVFVDGAFCAALSTAGLGAAAGEAGCFVGGASALSSQSKELQDRVTELLRPLPEKDFFLTNRRDALGCATMSALNQATLEDCACIICPDGSEDSEELYVNVAFITTGSSQACSSPRAVIDAGRRRRIRVVESHLSADPSDASASNGVCRVVLAEGAKVEHEVLQQKADDARLIESLTAEVGAGAEYQLRLVQSGARTARVNAAVALQGEGASCKVFGTMIADQTQQLDFHTLIHHSVPGCKSEQLHKNVVAGSAECIFKGSIRVDKEAQQTDSTQLCRTLLLTKKAKVKAMPSLQIQADDVTCSHGAAITELDEDEVFYMRSRGLNPSEAKKLLLVAFPQDLFGDLSDASPKAYQRVVDKLVRMADA